MGKIEKQVTILNEDGLHARPAGVLVKKASEFQSKIEIRSDQGVVKNAKSIMGLMSMGLEKGAVVTLIAEGVDAAGAIDALSSLIRHQLH